MAIIIMSEEGIGEGSFLVKSTQHSWNQGNRPPPSQRVVRRVTYYWTLPGVAHCRVFRIKFADFSAPVGWEFVTWTRPSTRPTPPGSRLGNAHSTPVCLVPGRSTRENVFFLTKDCSSAQCQQPQPTANRGPEITPSPM